MKKLILILIFTGWSVQLSFAQADLSNEAVFTRCYQQITGHVPSPNDGDLAAVKAGTKAPIAACLEILDKGLLVANGRTQINTSDEQSRQVFNQMHNLHASWFQIKDFFVIDSTNRSTGNQDLWDSSSPALFFTRALFDTNTRIDSVVLGSDNLLPDRTNNDPTQGAETSREKSTYAFTDPFSFAPRGDIIGVRSSPKITLNYTYSGNSGTADHFDNVGGGVIGSNVYLLQTLQESSSFRSNGGVSMPRKWGRAVFHDILCRDLPVARQADVTDLVVSGSSVPFRTQASCTVCHASIDRAASVVRGVRYRNFGGSSTERGGNFIYHEPVASGAESGWPASNDSSYYRRPTNGTLFFRNYLGNLVSMSVNGPGDLGTKISQQDDFYICVAKRYYAYFTGITVDTGDLGDPTHPGISAADKAHRDIVIELGKNLRTHQDPRQLISAILNQPHYKKSDYGLTQTGSLASE